MLHKFIELQLKSLAMGDATFGYLYLGYLYHYDAIGNESVPRIITNNTINLFFKLQAAFW